MSPSVVLDSSVWIEIFRSGPLLKACQQELNAARIVIVPSLVLFEVYKKIVSQKTEDLALSAIALLNQYLVQDLNQEIALTAADLSLQHHLAMADSIVLAHAVKTNSTLVTLDNDFEGILGTQVLRSKVKS